VQALLVRVGERKFAVPLSAVDRVRRTRREDVRLVEGRPSVMHDGQPVELALLADLLGLGARGDEDRRKEFPVVLTWGSRGVLGLVVDELLGEQEIVLKNFSRHLKHVPNFTGAAILGSSEIVLVLNCSDLHAVAARGRGKARAEFFKPVEEGQRKRILVTDDSLITRTMETRILAKAGYEVLEANDGIEAFDILKEQRVDLLVTDVQMPRMNGLELTKKVRSTQLLAELPVIVISFLDNEDDRMRGMEAGANAYLTKSQFTHNRFLSLVEQVIGGRG
jgi:CheY-like chemotaxis protein/chemotaxis signal transduction protein